MLLCLSLSMFRSESVGAAFHLYAQMFGASPGAPSTFEMREPVFMLLCAFSIIYLMPNAVELLRRVYSRDAKFTPAREALDNPNFRLVTFDEGSGFTLPAKGSCVGLRKSDTALLDQVNSILSGIDDDARAAMWQAAVDGQPQ